MLKSRINSLIIPIAGALAMIIPAMSPAAAQEAQQSVSVSYADLNLMDGDAAAQLERRVRAAAYRVCTLGNERNLDQLAAARACAERAMADAQPRVDVAINAARSERQLAQNAIAVDGRR